MTCIAGGAVPHVTRNPLVFLVHGGLTMCMTINTAEQLEVVRICMAVGTQIPNALVVVSRINREILSMVESGGDPGVLCMA